MTFKSFSASCFSELVNNTVTLSGMTLPTFNRLLDELEENCVAEYKGCKLTRQYLRSKGTTFSVEIPQRTRRVVAY
jgi:hypothetical protein